MISFSTENTGPSFKNKRHLIAITLDCNNPVTLTVIYVDKYVNSLDKIALHEVSKVLFVEYFLNICSSDLSRVYPTSRPMTLSWIKIENGWICCSSAAYPHHSLAM